MSPEQLDLLAEPAAPLTAPAAPRALPPQPPAPRDGTAAGRALRDQGVAQVEEASDDWARATIDQALEHVAKTKPDGFSANDVRPLLPPGIRPALVGARFLAASKRGLIRKVGFVASSDPGTHAHPIALWTATAQETAA